METMNNYIQKLNQMFNAGTLKKSVGVFVLTALTFIQSACDFSPKIHRDIIRAQQALIQQDFQRAIAKYEDILLKSPDPEIKLKIYYQLGEIYSLNFGQYEKAIEYFKLAQSVTDEPLWHVRSEQRIAEISFNFLKNYDQSIKSYTYLASFTPRLSESDLYEYKIAQSHYLKRNYQRSLELFYEIYANPQHSHYIQSMNQIALIYFEQKEWEEAISYWNRYIRHERRQENIVQARFLMANSYERKEDLKSAYNMYYSILGEYPNIDVVQNRLNSIFNRRVARKR